jgi:hypothetical protein
MPSNRQLGARRRRVYNEQERKILDGFKDRYLAQKTPGDKKFFAENDIYPGIFNHWEDNGMVFSVNEKKKREEVCRKRNLEYNLTSLIGFTLLDA